MKKRNRFLRTCRENSWNLDVMGVR
jgi:hypothetical protein